MKNKSQTVLSVLFFLLVIQVNAQNNLELTLSKAVQYGLKNNYRIQNAIYEQEKAEYKVGEVKSSAFPQLTAEGQFQNSPNLPTQILPGEIVGQPGNDVEVQFGTSHNANGTLKATQLLYSQEFFTGLKAAKASEELYMLQKINSEEEAIYEIAKAFYGVLQVKSQISVLDSNLNMINQLKELMKVQFENDVVTKTDYSRIKVNQVNLETQLQSLEASYEQQLNYLKLVLGMPISTEITVVEPSNLNNISIQNLSSEPSNQIQLDILKKQEALTVLNKKSIRAGYTPTLSLFGQQSWQAQRNEFNFFDNSQPWFQQTFWGVQLSIPIFDGFKKQRQIQQTDIDLQQLKLQQRQVEQQLDMQYTNSRKQLTNSLNAVKAQEQNKKLAKEVYDQTKLLYQEQVEGLTELLDAEQAYRNAQTNYYNELIKFKVSELDLLKSKGTITTLVTQ